MFTGFAIGSGLGTRSENYGCGFVKLPLTAIGVNRSRHCALPAGIILEVILGEQVNWSASWRSNGTLSCICCIEYLDCAAQLAVVAGEDSLAVWRGGGSALQWHCCAVCHSRLFALRFDPDSPATVMRKVGMPAVVMPTPDLRRSLRALTGHQCIMCLCPNYSYPQFLQLT